MAKADPAVLAKLAEAFEQHAAALAPVEKKGMFGCDGYFREGQIFGLIWKEGRIGVRLPEPASFSALMGEAGSGPWKAGTMVMSAWVLVPPGYHKDGRKLKKWIEEAHRQAEGGKTKPKAKAKTKAKAKGRKKAVKRG